MNDDMSLLFFWIGLWGTINVLSSSSFEIDWLDIFILCVFGIGTLIFGTKIFFKCFLT